jgi:hypothetical protein
MRKSLLLTAAILAAVFLSFLLTLPPHARPATGTVADDVRRTTVAGAFHVHSVRSDGTGDLDEIAAAASSAGLRYVVVTDHGDALRPPEPPRYRDGVLMIDAVEISTNQGHVIALDMPAAPYPLGGEARDVVEDIARLGGFSVAAHPDSPKPELQWADRRLVVDGLEWLNLDSEWRDESRVRLARAALDYLFRPGPALAGLLDRPSATLERWDQLTENRAVVALAGHDAHGGVAEGSRRGLTARFGVPSYEASFRAFGVRAMLAAELTGNASEDARSVMAAIRNGRTFTALDAVATPAFVEYQANAAGVSGMMGQTIPFAPDARMTIRATLPASSRMVLVRGGRDIAESRTGEMQVTADSPGSYRVEVRTDGGSGGTWVPWLVTNPIYLRSAETEDAAAPEVYSPVMQVSAAGAGVEKDPASEASLSPRDDGFALTYRLRPGDRVSQYVAVSVPMPPGTDARAVEFTGRAAAPLRVSVQLRFNEVGGARWVRSVYLATDGRRVVVPFREMVPADRHSTMPRSDTASSLLFVVDLTNAPPGSAGTFEMSRVTLVK